MMTPDAPRLPERTRIVRPSLWTDEATGRLTPEARDLYLGLATRADDEGWLLWRPATLGAHLLSYLPIPRRGRVLERGQAALTAAGLLIVNACGCALLPYLKRDLRVSGGMHSDTILRHHLAHSTDVSGCIRIHHASDSDSASDSVSVSVAIDDTDVADNETTARPWSTFRNPPGYGIDRSDKTPPEGRPEAPTVRRPTRRPPARRADWVTFRDPRWGPVREAWSRRFRRPPSGEEIETGTQRALLFEAVDAYPARVPGWIDAAPPDADPYRTVAYVLERLHEARTAGLEDAADQEAKAERRGPALPPLRTDDSMSEAEAKAAAVEWERQARAAMEAAP